MVEGGVLMCVRASVLASYKGISAIECAKRCKNKIYRKKHSAKDIKLNVSKNTAKVKFL